MASHPKSIINQVQLKKKALLSQISKLQKQIKRNQKSNQSRDKIKSKPGIKSPTSHSPMFKNNNQLTHSHSNKIVQPQISQNWKQLFKVQPQMYKNPQSQIGYFDKSDYQPIINYKSQQNQDMIFDYMSDMIYKNQFS